MKMTKKEKLALEYIEAVLSRPKHRGQVPVARKLIKALNESRRLSIWKKRANLDAAIKVFHSHSKKLAKEGDYSRGLHNQNQKRSGMPRMQHAESTGDPDPSLGR